MLQSAQGINSFLQRPCIDAKEGCIASAETDHHVGLIWPMYELMVTV